MSGRGRPRSSTLRDLGNAAFKAKKWQEAIDYYSQAIEIEFDREAEHVGALFCNRAAAYLNLCEYDLGEPAARVGIRALNVVLRGWRLFYEEYGWESGPETLGGLWDVLGSSSLYPSATRIFADR